MEALYTFFDLTGLEQPREVLERALPIEAGRDGTLVGACCEPLGQPMPVQMADAYYELWRIVGKRRHRVLGMPLVLVNRMPHKLRSSVAPGDELLLRVTVPTSPCKVLLAAGIYVDPGRATR